MEELVDHLLDWLETAPTIVMYLVVAAAAFLENIIPPLPSDVFILFGSVLAGRGAGDPWLVYLVVWFSNVAGAFLIYWFGVHYGPGFFEGRFGRLLLNPGQLEKLAAFYRRFGVLVVFASRFLPMFRAVVPVFAGVARIGFWHMAPPLALASGLWYGFVVYTGAAAGRNWEELMDRFGSIGFWFWAPAALAIGAVALWWWRSR